MKRFYRICLLLSASLLLMIPSCKKETGGTDVKENSIKLVDSGNENLSFPYEGAAPVDFKIVATGDWTAEPSADWISVEPAAGTKGTRQITVAVLPNGTQDARKGEITFTCGKATMHIKVSQTGMAALGGLPAVWNFFRLGYVPTTSPDALKTDYAKNWSISANPIKVTATSGNAAAFISPVCAKGVVNVTLAPAMQVQGILEGDSYLLTIPVTGFRTGTQIRVSAATGGAPTSVGFWVMEYSDDATTWHEVPGAQTVSAGTASVKAHFWNTPESTTGTSRLFYFGKDDSSFHKYTFACDGIKTINEGNLYIRLRALKYSLNGSDIISSWTDLKHIAVGFASDPEDADPEPHLYKIVAHRGGYIENGYPACSVQALKETIRQHCYGSECDIMWTVDNDVIVCHPETGNLINGLDPSVSTLAAIQAVKKLPNGEVIPSLRDYLKVITDKSINPLGTKLWLDVKGKNNDMARKVMYRSAEIAKEMNACEYIEFLVPSGYAYTEVAADMRNNYGIACAWNGKITTPGAYGPQGWGQLQYSGYRSSVYWPPTYYTQQNVTVSVYHTPSNYSDYNKYYPDVAPYYKDVKALFVNHPLYILSYLIRDGYETL